jgi:phosphate starvation-inducible protein PhoH
LTFRDCIIIFDEFQSATFHEIDSVLTRIGENCRFILCGDFAQNDLNNKKEKSGFIDAVRILDKIDDISHIQFGIDDIVRSGFVRKYLTEKQNLGI